jgi:hypothetical protein
MKDEELTTGLSRTLLHGVKMNMNCKVHDLRMGLWEILQYFPGTDMKKIMKSLSEDC